MDKEMRVRVEEEKKKMEEARKFFNELEGFGDCEYGKDLTDEFIAARLAANDLFEKDMD